MSEGGNWAEIETNEPELARQVRSAIDKNLPKERKECKVFYDSIQNVLLKFVGAYPT